MNVKIIGRDNVGWSIDKDRANLERFLSRMPGIRVVGSYILADAYFFVWHDQVRHPRYCAVHILKALARLAGKRKKIIAWITNDISQSDAFLKKRWGVDVWVAPSEKVAAFLRLHGIDSVVVPFYVSPRAFYRTGMDRSEIARRLGIDPAVLEGKLVFGSFQRDSLGTNLLAPKWQKNPDLLISICKSFSTLFPQQNCLLLLAGPRRHYVVSRCVAEGIPYLFVGDNSVFAEHKDDIFINNLTEETINLLYNSTDLYLVTSKSEGGPKAIMEASLAKTLIISTDVGLAKDFLHPDLIYSEGTAANVLHAALGTRSTAQAYIDYNYARASAVLDAQSYSDRIKSIVRQAMV